MTALLLALALAGAPKLDSNPSVDEIESNNPTPTLESPSAPLPAEPRHGLLAAAAWCVLKTDDDASASDDEAADLPGCDLGMGVAIVRHRRLSWVAVIGTNTVGTGLAWRVSGASPQVVAVAVGAVVRYDDTGIDAREVYPAIGATLSFARGQ